MSHPVAKRNTLLLVAGIVWTAVGLGLCIAAGYWLATTGGRWLIETIAGLIAGLLAYYFGFLRLVRKNMARLSGLAPDKEKICLFAFQGRRSYAIMIFMIALGYTLRHSGVPRPYLAPVYLAIGLALFLASLHYYAASR